MARKHFIKLNDVSQSRFILSHTDQEYKPATNIAVGMGRVSIKENKDGGNSDLDQIERVTEYAVKKNFTLARTWDVAETGFKHERRKNFNEMCEFVRAHPEIKHIIFSHQSRSNRNRDSAKELESLIRHHGVTIHCVRDGLVLHERSPIEDWLRWDIFNILNEKYSKDHKLNVLGGMRKNIESGVFPGLAPFGYRNIRIGGPDGDPAFEIVAEEAAYVRSAFEWFATGRYSFPALKKELEATYPSLRGRLAVQRIGDMLRNPFYYGYFRIKGELFQGHSDFHPKLITLELFDRVQAILDRPERSKRKVTQRDHPYLGMLKCGGRILDNYGQETDETCGCSVTAEEKRKRLADGSIKTYIYYHCASIRRCSQREASFAAHHGFKTNLTEGSIETLFGPILAPLSFSPEAVKWMQDHLLQEHSRDSGDHKQATTALLARRTMLLKMIDSAYEDKLRGDLRPDEWRAKDVRWRAELEEVKAAIDNLDLRKEDAIHRGVELIELVQHFEKIYKSATSEKKRRIVEIVSSNHVLRNGSIGFEYKKPFDLLVEGYSKEKWWT